MGMGRHHFSSLFALKYFGWQSANCSLSKYASVVRWLFRGSLSASGGSCDFSSSGYWSFGASRAFMHGILVMAWVESKVAELAAFC
jgi:hypothetical protein